jgi:hypothetical protein
MQIGRLANVHFGSPLNNLSIIVIHAVLDKKHLIVSQSHLVVKATVMFHREFKVARVTRVVSVYNVL